jgi:hypothetical protein
VGEDLFEILWRMDVFCFLYTKAKLAIKLPLNIAKMIVVGLIFGVVHVTICDKGGRGSQNDTFIPSQCVYH